MCVVLCWLIAGRNKIISFVVPFRFSFAEDFEDFHCFPINHFVMDAVTRFTLKRQLAVYLFMSNSD